jgi:hypothetical protein
LQLSAVWVAVLLSQALPDAGVPPKPAGPRNPPIDLSVPKMVAYTEVGNRMMVDGQPIKVWAVRSRLRLQELLQSYIDRFEDHGYYLPKPRDIQIQGLDLPKIVAFDPKEHWSYIIWGWPERDGTTTLIIGAADVSPQAKEAAGRGGQLPVFPGAKAPVVSNVEAARMLAFTTRATEAEVLDFYRQVLPTGGFKERESGTFVKEGRAVRVMVKPARAELSVVVIEQPDSMPEPWLREARESVQPK